MASDEELAELVRGGRTGLWPELADRVMRMAWPIISYWVRMDDREDVVQDVLMRFVKALPAYDAERAPLKAFVAVLARRQVIDHFRAQGRRPPLQPIDFILDVAAAAPGQCNPGPELVTLIEQVVGEKATKALLMHVFDGYSYREIGEALSVSPAAAKMRVRRAIRRLKLYLGARDG